MNSWRDLLSPPDRADMERLLDTALGIARSALAGSSEFDPFAILIDLEGRTLQMELDLAGLGKHPETEQILSATESQLRGLSETSRCTALTVNTRLAKERTDAIEVRLEHKASAALLVLLPYRRPKFGGAIEYGALTAFAAQSDVFA
ncbi:MAG: hypothetical protein LH471_09510 [Salinibacterium sp.]|nr:hypothetical protein [Salinibacterium sp.]